MSFLFTLLKAQDRPGLFFTQSVAISQLKFDINSMSYNDVLAKYLIKLSSSVTFCRKMWLNRVYDRHLMTLSQRLR